MEMCGAHWSSIVHKALDAGLTFAELPTDVMPNSSDAVLAMQDIATTTITRDNFHSFYLIHFTVVDELVRLNGLRLLYIAECPICTADLLHANECSTAGCQFVTFAVLIGSAVGQIKGFADMMASTS